MQERQLLVQALHQAAEGVEEKAGVLHSLFASLVLGHVQRNAEHLAQLGPPSIVRLRVGQGPEAHGAAAGEARAGSVPGHQVIEHEVIHPHDAVHGTRRGAAELARCRPPQRGVAQQAQGNTVQRAARGSLAEMRDRPPG